MRDQGACIGRDRSARLIYCSRAFSIVAASSPQAIKQRGDADPTSTIEMRIGDEYHHDRYCAVTYFA
jgi:hypothetical protein